jgi:hypothetical protein
MFANAQMMGMDLGFPDVCLTPTPVGPIPIPYPNIALGPSAVGFVPNVMFAGTPAQNLCTEVPLTNGDNGGLSGGVASGTVMGPSRHLTGSFSCLVGGMPATRLTSMSLQNSTNCPGVRLVPSQVKILMLGA